VIGCRSGAGVLPLMRTWARRLAEKLGQGRLGAQETG